MLFALYQVYEETFEQWKSVRINYLYGFTRLIVSRESYRYIRG